MAQLGNGTPGPLMRELIRDASIDQPRGIGISPATRRAAQRAKDLERAGEHQALPNPPIVAERPNRNGNGHTELTPELRRHLRLEIDRRRRPLARKLDLAERAVEKDRRKLEREERTAA